MYMITSLTWVVGHYFSCKCLSHIKEWITKSRCGQNLACDQDSKYLHVFFKVLNPITVLFRGIVFTCNSFHFEWSISPLNISVNIKWYRNMIRILALQYYILYFLFVLKKCTIQISPWNPIRIFVTLLSPY